jgi:hypothetical protein
MQLMHFRMHADSYNYNKYHAHGHDGLSGTKLRLTCHAVMGMVFAFSGLHYLPRMYPEVKLWKHKQTKVRVTQMQRFSPGQLTL